jgi:hypothetical protein
MITIFFIDYYVPGVPSGAQLNHSPNYEQISDKSAPITDSHCTILTKLLTDAIKGFVTTRGLMTEHATCRILYDFLRFLKFVLTFLSRF